MTGSGDGRTECKQDPSRVFLPLAKETAALTTSFRGRQRANLGCRKVLVVFFLTLMASSSGGSAEGRDSAAVKVFSCLFPRGLTGVDPWLNCGGLMTQESVCMCVCCHGSPACSRF